MIKRCVFLAIATMVLILPIVHGGVFSKNLNNPPNPPSITGPTDCRLWRYYNYIILITDPDNDSMTRLEVNFGDGTHLIISAPCCWRSGTEIPISHRWRRLGDFTVSARVMDVYGEWSEWGYLNVHVTKIKSLPQLRFTNQFSLLPDQLIRIF